MEERPNPRTWKAPVTAPAARQESVAKVAHVTRVANLRARAEMTYAVHDNI